jgi:hypothetical protein
MENEMMKESRGAGETEQIRIHLRYFRMTHQKNTISQHREECLTTKGGTKGPRRARR